MVEKPTSLAYNIQDLLNTIGGGGIRTRDTRKCTASYKFAALTVQPLPHVVNISARGEIRTHIPRMTIPMFYQLELLWLNKNRSLSRFLFYLLLKRSLCTFDSTYSYKPSSTLLI